MALISDMRKKNPKVDLYPGTQCSGHLCGPGFMEEPRLAEITIWDYAEDAAELMLCRTCAVGLVSILSKDLCALGDGVLAEACREIN